MNKKLFAIFTNVKNEKDYLPIWLKHYSKYVPYQDIYIYDDNTTDGSTDNLPCNVIKLPHYPYDYDTLYITKIVNDVQKELLQKYEYIMYVQADGIIFHTKYDNLCDYIKWLKQNNIGNIRTNGFHVVQNINVGQKQYNPNKTILSQRSYWLPDVMRCVPAISNYYLNYKLAFHDAPNMNNGVDSELIYFHLHVFDYNIHMDRKLTMGKNAKYIDNPDWGWQNKLQTRQKIDEFFMMNLNDKKLQKIPQHIKDLNII